MKKIIIKKYGGYNQLQYLDASIPKPPPGHILVRTKSIGVNYADVCVRWGIYESAKKLKGLPITPGFEFSGKIEECGENVEDFQIGERVFGLTFFEAYSEFVIVPAHQLFKIPPNLTYDEASAFPVTFITAYHALFQNVILRKGMKILVHSAAGGVGSSLVQLAKIKECHVTGVVGKAHKVELVENLGANKVIDKSKEKLWEKAESISPEGFDIILDANGYSTLKDSYHHLKPTGKLISYGFHSMLPKKGGKINYLSLALNYLKSPWFNPVHMSNLNKSLITFNLSFLFSRKDLLEEAIFDLLSMLKEEKIKLPPITTFPLKEVAKAHQAIESGETIGKIVLNS
ncbi:MAG: zinc-binding dehydrogenase [Halobacteriovoraceae bacterium]|nr:zinc-binding dehydrogenase [Halobacteriovoraceae bacterium]